MTELRCARWLKEIFERNRQELKRWTREQLESAGIGRDVVPETEIERLERENAALTERAEQAERERDAALAKLATAREALDTIWRGNHKPLHAGETGMWAAAVVIAHKALATICADAGDAARAEALAARARAGRLRVILDAMLHADPSVLVNVICNLRDGRAAESWWPPAAHELYDMLAALTHADAGDAEAGRERETAHALGKIDDVTLVQLIEAGTWALELLSEHAHWTWNEHQWGWYVYVPWEGDFEPGADVQPWADAANALAELRRVMGSKSADSPSFSTTTENAKQEPMTEEARHD